MNELSDAGCSIVLYHEGKEVQTMKYLKVFTDFLDAMAPLTDEEAGRLYRAMLQYAANGTEQELSGNERYLWVIARQNMDREAEAYENMVEARREAGRRSGKVRREQKEQTGTKTNKTNQDKDKEKDNDKDKDKDKDISFLTAAAGAEKKEMHPSLGEIKRYVEDTHLPVDAEHFYNYYEANGWYMGQNPMQNWKAAVKAWARNVPVASRTAPVKKPDSKDTFLALMERARMEEAKQV